VKINKELEIEIKNLREKLQEAEQREKRQLEAQNSDSELLGHHQVPTATSSESSRNLGTFPRGFADRRGLHTLTWSQRFVGLRMQPGNTSSIQTWSVRVHAPVSGPGTISRVFASLGLRSLNPLR